MRVNYDEIAHLYDTQPDRSRATDPEFLAFVGQRDAAVLAVLDIGCGTGNQLIADRNAAPDAGYFGLDRSFGTRKNLLLLRNAPLENAIEILDRDGPHCRLRAP